MNFAKSLLLTSYFPPFLTEKSSRKERMTLQLPWKVGRSWVTITVPIQFLRVRRNNYLFLNGNYSLLIIYKYK